MEPDLLIKIAGIGLMIAVICQVLSKAGREDIATLVTVAGVILVLFTVLDLVTELFSRVQAMFLLS
ncbi:MAG: stage III sporulation protein AC [Clostridia bacterium]|nr:stage III sporulation protein AC [Clostridia bacterium]